MNDLVDLHRLDSAIVIVFKNAALMNPIELDRLRRELYAELDQSRRSTVLDFRNVEFMSSQAVGLLLGLKKKVSEYAGAKLILCDLRPKLMELLKLTRLDKILTIHKTHREALDALEADQG